MLDNVEKFVESHDKLLLDGGTIALAIGTLLLFIATFGVFWATRRLVREGAETARRQLRAYVTLANGSFVLVRENNSMRISADVNLQNYGKTPAYSFITWISIDLVQPSRDFHFSETTLTSAPSGVSVVGPFQTVNTGRAVAITQGDLEDILMERKAVYVWGAAVYIDAFGTNRHFRFRCEMTGAPQPNGFWPLKPHYSGYSAN